jgi:hypothetical protein
MRDYRDVTELSREELNELKQAYLCEKVDSPSYGELADSTNIPDKVIFAHYAGVAFGPEDFFCSTETESSGKEEK